MAKSVTELMSRGMECLTEGLGVVEAEEFISLVIRERFDYTKWQREYFDSMEPGKFHDRVVQHSMAHPYTGTAERL